MAPALVIKASHSPERRRIGSVGAACRCGNSGNLDEHHHWDLEYHHDDDEYHHDREHDDDKNDRSDKDDND